MYDYELKSIGNVEVKEFLLEYDGFKLSGFLGKGNHYNWLSLPQLSISVELADFDDASHNRGKLISLIDDPSLVDLLIKVLYDLHDRFGKDEQDCFDGKTFITTREYTFWLESECESLSYQLIQLENDSLSSSWNDLSEERLSFYAESREQYGTDAL